MKLQLVLVIALGSAIADSFLLEYLAAILKIKFFTPPPDKINSEFFSFGECSAAVRLAMQRREQEREDGK